MRKSGITAIIDDEIWSADWAPVETAFGAPPILRQGLTLPCEHGGGVTGNDRSGVVLSGEDVAGAPTDLGAEGG
ncbi:hypothetical protein HPP92_003546 [Vanilla planifolia]|uniref:Uncharacterized protein n=1 Tax=Vanilla planifolia TaxID=51239 RepID=A0A835S1Z6_VANPL|nr:hypothetical protein HPP92_003546 [Vanilla planifolia]